MEEHWVYAKTESGESVVRTRTRLAHRDLRAVLIQVDGVINVGALKQQVGDGKLVESSLNELERLKLVERRGMPGSGREPRAAIAELALGRRHREPGEPSLWLRWRARLAAWRRRRQAQRDERAFLRAYEMNSAEDNFAPVKLKPIRRGPRRRGNWLLRGLGGLVLLVLMLTLSVMIFPYDHYRPLVERRLSTALGAAVRIDSLGFSIQPYPNITLSGVAIGDACLVGAIRVVPAPFFLFADEWVIEHARFEDLTLRRRGIAASARWFALPAGDKATILLRRASLEQVTVDVDGARLDGMRGEMQFKADGAVARIVLRHEVLGLDLAAVPQGDGYQLTLSGSASRLPLMPDLSFDFLEAQADISEQALRLSRFEARLYGGSVTATAQVDWSAAAQLNADVTLSHVSLEKLAKASIANFSIDADLSGKLHFAAQAETLSGLAKGLRYQGTFATGRGQIDGVDLMEALRGTRPTRGGHTRFEKLVGNLQRDGAGMRLGDLRIDAGALQGAGVVDIDRGARLKGSLALELKGPAVVVKTLAAVGGDLADPQLSPGRSERSVRR